MCFAAGKLDYMRADAGRFAAQDGHRTAAREIVAGGHFRDDYPDKDPAFATFNLIARKGRDGGMELTRAPLADLPPALKAIIEANK